MKAKITQEVIHTLNKNEIFVFGSNEAGNHAGGAARKAAKDFGANGNGEGLQGQFVLSHKQVQKNINY